MRGRPQLLGVFSAGPELFRAGWFAESLATQTLVIVVIRTRRTPFLRSRPSAPLLGAALAVVLIGVAIPFTPFGALLGFAAPPATFVLVLIGIVIVYLVIVDASKQVFFAGPEEHRPHVRRRGRPHRVHRRAARFSVPTTLSG